MFIRDQKGRPQNIVSRFENLPLWLSIFIQLTIFCRAMFFFSLFPSVSNFLDRLRSNKCQTWQTDETSSLLLQQVKRLTTWVQLQGSVFKANSIFSRVCGPTKLPIRMPNFRFPKSTNFDSSRILPPREPPNPTDGSQLFSFLCCEWCSGGWSKRSYNFKSSLQLLGRSSTSNTVPYGLSQNAQTTYH